MKNNQKMNASYVTFVASIGMFLSTLDSGLINVAIPSLTNIFKTSLNHVVWIVTLYTLVVSTTIMLFGKLADYYGRLKIYVIGLTLFALSSFFSGVSTNIHTLIIFRCFQGLSAAMLQATAVALITSRLKSEELTKSIGIIGMLMGLGPLLGPIIAGILLSTIGWRWIFWLNIPICLIALYGCQKLNMVQENLHQKPINYLSLCIFGFSMMFMLFGMNYLPIDMRLAFYFFIAMFFFFLLYIFIELKSEHPIIDYKLFQDIKFTAPLFGMIAIGSATAIVFILPPLFFEKLRSFATWQFGLVCLSAPLGLAIAPRILIRFLKSLKTEFYMLFGIAVMLLSLLVLSNIQIEWQTSFIVLLLFIYGIGTGFLMTTTILYLTSQFPIQKQAFISALIRMIQNVGIAFGAAGSVLLMSLKKHNSNLLLGIQESWQLAAVITMIAFAALIYMYFTLRKSGNVRERCDIAR